MPQGALPVRSPQRVRVGQRAARLPGARPRFQQGQDPRRERVRFRHERPGPRLEVRGLRGPSPGHGVGSRGDLQALLDVRETGAGPHLLHVLEPGVERGLERRRGLLHREVLLEELARRFELRVDGFLVDAVPHHGEEADGGGRVPEGVGDRRLVGVGEVDDRDGVG